MTVLKQIRTISNILTCAALCFGCSSAPDQTELGEQERGPIAEHSGASRGRIGSVRSALGEKPDFRVASVEVGGCTSSGGSPVVMLRVTNQGTAAGSCWVDVFHGLAAPPAIGTLSDIFTASEFIPPGGTDIVFLDLSGVPPGGRWIDVLLDTTREVDETNESNNHGEAFLDLPDCSFN